MEAAPSTNRTCVSGRDRCARLRAFPPVPSSRAGDPVSPPVHDAGKAGVMVREGMRPSVPGVPGIGSGRNQSPDDEGSIIPVKIVTARRWHSSWERRYPSDDRLALRNGARGRRHHAERSASRRIAIAAPGSPGDRPAGRHPRGQTPRAPASAGSARLDRADPAGEGSEVRLRTRTGTAVRPPVSPASLDSMASSWSPPDRGRTLRPYPTDHPRNGGPGIEATANRNGRGQPEVCSMSAQRLTGVAVPIVLEDSTNCADEKRRTAIIPPVA